MQAGLFFPDICNTGIEISNLLFRGLQLRGGANGRGGKRGGFGGTLYGQRLSRRIPCAGGFHRRSLCRFLPVYGIPLGLRGLQCLPRLLHRLLGLLFCFCRWTTAAGDFGASGVAA